MEARVDNSEGQFEQWRAAPGSRDAHVRRTIWWKFALAAILLAIILTLAASAFLHSQREDAPMQVESKALMA